MHQLYSLLAIALRKDEGQKSEDRFKCCLSSPELSPAERKIKKNIEEISAQKSGRRRDEAPKRVVSLLACHHVRLEYLKLSAFRRLVAVENGMKNLQRSKQADFLDARDQTPPRRIASLADSVFAARACDSKVSLLAD